MIKKQSNKAMPVFFTSYGLTALLFILSLFVQSSFAGSLDDCLMEVWKKADDATTIGELKRQCQKQIEIEISTAEKTRSAVEDRLLQDEENILKPFTLMSHKPNYFLLAAYNSHGYDSSIYQDQFNDSTLDMDDTETQFQLSVKFPLLVDMFDSKIDLFAAYTVHSYWQVYNDLSSPFRETNHEPEAWIQIRPDWNILGFTNTMDALGIVHQSNGRGGFLSRFFGLVPTTCFGT